MFRWLAGRGARQSEVERCLQQLGGEPWEQVVSSLPFLARLSAAEHESLRQRTAWILASKSFSGAHGFEPGDRTMLSIAVQAALPILHLDVSLYEGWTEIIVYPGGFLIPRTDVDEAGVVHEYVQEASGEAWEGGPVVLSWEDVQGAGDDPVNVVIHEFAHKLDLQAGDADGMPSLAAHPDISPRRWHQVLERSFATFERAVIAIEDSIPHDVDPESEEGAAWFEALPLDPYAATDPAEFFAVSSEAFFVDPGPLAAALPEWYDLLCHYYRQNPLAGTMRSAASFPGSRESDA